MSRSLLEWLAYIEQQHPRSIELGLDRSREVAARLGITKPAPQVIIVGGTNGKGSTVAFIEAIGQAAGMKTGAYVSPHLHRYNERVRIDGNDASDESLTAAFEAVETARGGTPLTYFEFGTLAALWLFQRSDLDLAVLEVGLGGRLDAVNIVDADVAVITTVDIDHVDWLGHDRESIGYEKAGIARAWKPLVLGELDSPSSVLRHAYAIGANAIRMGSDFFHETIDDLHWRWRDAGFEIELPNPSLAAPVQRTNAATAIAALRALDIEIPPAAFAKGIAAANPPARLQRVMRQGAEVWVDVGHNPQAARELAIWLQARPVAGKTHAVFAALGDKDMTGIVAAVSPGIDQWWLAGLEEAGARGMNVEAFAALLQGTSAGKGRCYPDVQAALVAAIDGAETGDRILVFGSFFTASIALQMLGDDV